MSEWLALCAFFLALHLGVNWKKWFGSEETKTWDKYQRWVATRLDQGASWDDIRDEREIRYHLAQLRETVSDHVARGGKADWEQTMQDQVRASVSVLSCLDPALGKKFLNVVSGLHDSDILYPAEHEIVFPTRAPVRLTKEQRKQWARTLNASMTDL